MNQSLQIIADQFPHINGLQMTNLAPIFDTKSDSWKCNKQFQSILPPSVQIHHTGRDHWVLSLESRDNEVCILDSLSNIKNHTVNTPSLEIQLSQIYKKDKTSIPIKILDIQQQENGNDCGLFAIANLVEFCYKEKNFESKTSFKTECMREHLIQCLERGYFTKFPQNYNLNSNCTLKHKMVKIQCCCPCGFPDWVDAMIGCDFKAGRKSCNVWKHTKCANVTSDCNEWICNKHRE